MIRKKAKLSKDNVGYLFIAPYFIAFLVFSMYPILYTFKLSFSSWDGIADPVFVGAANYTRLIFDPVFYKSIYNTVIMALAAMVPQMVFGLALAFILNQSHIKGTNIFKAVFYFPNLVTAVSLGVLFSLLFDWQAGSVNKVLLAAGLINEEINWKADTFYSRAIISFVLWWQYFGYYTIIFTAGIKGISNEILEAAEIDGASRMQTFGRIVLPLLRPIMTYAFVTSIIGGLQIFDLPYTFGTPEGNPNKSLMTMTMFMYNTSFRNYNYGYGAAISYGLFVIIIIFSLIFMRYTVGKETNK